MEVKKTKIILDLSLEETNILTKAANLLEDIEYEINDCRESNGYFGLLSEHHINEFENIISFLNDLVTYEIVLKDEG